jgi:acyl-CoA thioesterase
MTDARRHARKIVRSMYQKDRFSQLLGIKVYRVEPGSCILKMKISKEMVNGFHTVHGGVTFAFADSALAFASNSHGRLSVALEASISYPKPVHVGDALTASAEEISTTNKTGVYLITITNQRKQKVAVFKGTVYRTSREI